MATQEIDDCAFAFSRIHSKKHKMENNKETTVNIANYDSYKEVIAKWIRILFACQIVNLLAAALGAIAAIGSIAGWLSRIVTVAIIIALFNLSVVGYYEPQGENVCDLPIWIL